MKTGYALKGAESNLAGAFLLWRGAAMRQERITPFEKNVGKDEVYLPGNTSTSRNPLVALGFALDKHKADYTPVIFVIICRNFYPPDGICMNNEAYSAYPDEGEFLLTDGCKMYILDVQYGFKISNNFRNMQRYDGKTVTLIHMYHER